MGKKKQEILAPGLDILQVFSGTFEVRRSGYKVIDLKDANGWRVGQTQWGHQGVAEIPPSSAPPVQPIGAATSDLPLYSFIPPPPGRYLAPSISFDPDERITYDPWSIRHLFQTFAETPLTEAGGIAFANQFGLLGKETYVVHHPVDTPGAHLKMELVSRWFAEIVRLRSAISLLDLSRVNKKSPIYADSIRRLEKVFNVVRFGKSYYPDMNQTFKEEWLSQDEAHREFAKVYGKHWSPYFADRPEELTKEQALRMTAYYFAVQQTNAELLRGVSPLVSLERRRPVEYAPRYLLAFLWLQFSLEIATSKNSKTCAMCGASLFGRSDKAETCSAKCKQKLWRRRQAGMNLDDNGR